MYKKLCAPIMVQVEITGDCTQCCCHCYNFWRNRAGKLEVFGNKSLDPKRIPSLVNCLHEVKVFKTLITGGEPLTCFGVLVDLLKQARQKGLWVGINSNLVLMTQEKAEIVRNLGVDHILTSILGPNAEVHDCISGRDGMFIKLLGGIRNARDAGIKVTANMVVSKINRKEVRETARLVQSLGVKSFTATKAGCPGNCSDFSHLRLDRDELVQMFNDLLWAKETLGLKIDTLEPVPFCTLAKTDNPEPFMSRRCCAGVTSLTISYDGSVRPCSHLDVSYGNLFQENMSSIWSRMNPWTAGQFIPEKCRVCEFVVACAGGCRMEAKTFRDNLCALDPYAFPSEIKECEVPLRKALTNLHGQKSFNESNRFVCKPFKAREESFGGIAMTEFEKTVVLSKKGFQIVMSLHPGTVYSIDGSSIDWKGLNAASFVRGLVNNDFAKYEL